MKTPSSGSIGQDFTIRLIYIYIFSIFLRPYLVNVYNSETSFRQTLRNVKRTFESYLTDFETLIIVPGFYATLAFSVAC